MTDPDNHCFCHQTFEYCDQWCDYSHNLFGLPFGITYPHFLYSPRWQQYVHGLNPDEARHSIHLYLEPTLGVPMYGHIALQINILFEPFLLVPGLRELPKVLLPIGYVIIVSGKFN